MRQNNETSGTAHIENVAVATARNMQRAKSVRRTSTDLIANSVKAVIFDCESRFACTTSFKATSNAYTGPGALQYDTQTI